MRKLKKIIATVLAATMMMAMGVTAFAATPTGDGSYTANQSLYKDAACTKKSMGNDAVKDLVAYIDIENGKATLTVNTHEITYLGLTGHLGKMTIGEDTQEAQLGDNGEYYFTFENLDASQFTEGCVITGKYTTYVGKMPMKATGYLKLTNITLATE